MYPGLGGREFGLFPFILNGDLLSCGDVLQWQEVNESFQQAPPLGEQRTVVGAVIDRHLS